METLHGKDQEQVKPLRILDEGITGYVFELLPLLRAIRIFAKNKNPDSTSHTNSITDTTNNESTPSNPVETQDVTRLIKASLSPLPHTKLRVAYSSPSPHQILRLIRDIGVDLFDAHWAQKAADLGIALDFRFPFPEIQSSPGPASRPSTQPRGKRNLGHNLFLSSYATDHSRLASSFVAAAEVAKQPPTENDEIQVCPCSACSPLSPSSYLEHSTAEDHDFINAPPTIQPPYTRAYIHHLLHTHEMSSHSLLAMHNLSVVDAFFSGIRKMLGDPNGKDKFEEEVDRFCATYDEDMTILHEAEKDWNRVELERGKGRLAREKERQQAQDSTNSTVAAT